MRSCPTAACYIDADITPLNLRGEAAVIEMTERYRRAQDDHPNNKIVREWKESNRIKQKSILKVDTELQHKHNLPVNREKETPFHEINPLNQLRNKAEIKQMTHI